MKHSRRAAIFAEVLTYINNGDWRRQGEFLVFGKEAFDRYTGDSLEEPCGLEDFLRNYVSNVKNDRGNISVKKRISTAQLPNEPNEEALKEVFGNWFLSQPEAFRSQFVRERSQDIKPLEREPEPPPSHVEDPDDRDAYLALEAIEWMDRANARLSTLDETEVSRGSVSYAEYFEEAHRCNLAGLKIATAVLCRAVLESALIQSTDPKREIKNRRKDKESYILLMLDAASKAHILDDERIQAGDEIKKAGDAAIHNPSGFRQYSGRMNHIVDNTRKVVAELYASLEREKG